MGLFFNQQLIALAVLFKPGEATVPQHHGLLQVAVGWDQQCVAGTATCFVCDLLTTCHGGNSPVGYVLYMLHATGSVVLGVVAFCAEFS